MTSSKILSNLNPEQLAAVTTIERPLKVVAGAGSGKTRVITTKIAHLIEDHHYFGNKILAVTFTNKAANEMRKRVTQIIDEPFSQPWILTYHALAVRILRRHHEVIDIPKYFNIIDAGDQKKIIRKVLKNLFPGEEINRQEWEKMALSWIRNWKNQNISPEEAKQESLHPETGRLAKIYAVYEKELSENYALDFDDLLLKALLILKTDKEALSQWQHQFNYILVDEFQDTNQIQFDLIRLLIGDSPHLTVVGDPDQTIYTWRGANIDLINNFHHEFSDSETIILKRNYRSTQEILDLANDFIALNPHQELKKLQSDDRRGSITEVYDHMSIRGEAKFIANKIKQLKKEKGYQNSDFFVLYRSNYWSRNLEEIFTLEKLPYDLIGGFKFRERKVIKDAMAFLKVLLTNDDLSMERVLTVTPKVGDKTINKLFHLAQDKKISVFELLTHEQPYVLEISKYLEPLRTTFLEAKKFNFDGSIHLLAKFLLTKSGYWDYISHIDTEEEGNLDNLREFLQQLMNFDKEFEIEKYGTSNRLLAFLQEEALTSNEDNEQTPNKILLSTIHSVKGLENKIVFVAGLSDSVFPSVRSMNSLKDLEEERRLLYVAITRAQKLLYLNFVHGDYSNVLRKELKPSIFIGELNKKFYHWRRNPFITQKEINKQPFLSYKMNMINDKTDFRRNDLVHHFSLGDGVVTKVVGDEVYVAFNNPKFGIQAIAITSPVLRKK